MLAVLSGTVSIGCHSPVLTTSASPELNTLVVVAGSTVGAGLADGLLAIGKSSSPGTRCLILPGLAGANAFLFVDIHETSQSGIA